MAKTKSKTTKKAAKKEPNGYPFINGLLPIIERVVGHSVDKVVASAIDGETMRCVFSGGEVDVQKIEEQLAALRIGDHTILDLVESAQLFLDKIKKASE